MPCSYYARPSTVVRRSAEANIGTRTRHELTHGTSSRRSLAHQTRHDDDGDTTQQADNEVFEIELGREHAGSGLRDVAGELA